MEDALGFTEEERKRYPSLIKSFENNSFMDGFDVIDRPQCCYPPVTLEIQ